MGAGKAHGIHVSLATGADIAQLVGAGDSLADDLGKLDAGGIVGEKGHAPVKLFADGFIHLFMPMAKDHRAGTDQIVDIFSAVFIDDM